MPYLSGNASNFNDLKLAIENLCTANGYALSNDVFSKNGCFYKLVAGTQNNLPQLQLFAGTGQSGSDLLNTPPGDYGVKLSSNAGAEIVFPINYELYLFTNPEEFYCIINYNSDFYQQLSFGKSDVQGIGGTGLWFTGSRRSDIILSDPQAAKVFLAVGWPEYVYTETYSGYGCGMFLDWYGNYVCSYVHTGLDSTYWRSATDSQDLTGYKSGGVTVASLLMQLPNLSNNADILLPIKPVAKRASGGVTIIANPKNARYVRIDNLTPGEIITFGSDRWKCYPLYRKDSVQRNGVYWNIGATHSGTFGYAIKYEGP